MSCYALDYVNESFYFKAATEKFIFVSQYEFFAEKENILGSISIDADCSFIKSSRKVISVLAYYKIIPRPRTLRNIHEQEVPYYNINFEHILF